jgi:hypothetical protein
VRSSVLKKRGRPAPTRSGSREVLRDWVGKEIGPIAKPKDIRFGDNLPKTRSGKIMRRLLRSIAKGEANHPRIFRTWRIRPSSDQLKTGAVTRGLQQRGKTKRPAQAGLSLEPPRAP